MNPPNRNGWQILQRGNGLPVELGAPRDAARMDPARAQALLPEVEGDVSATPGWHDWLWDGRLKQVRAELALACGNASTAFEDAQAVVEYWRGNGRTKYEALGQVTAARALRARGRTREAIAHARDALAVARRCSDPALVLWTLNVLLALDGDDALAGEARSVSAAIKLELPDESMQRRFDESELVQRFHTVSRASSLILSIDVNGRCL